MPYIYRKEETYYFNDLVNKFITKPFGWYDKHLSYGGKVVLISSVIQVIPTYTLTTLNTLNTTLTLIEKYIANFFWGLRMTKEKYHWSA